MSEKRVERRLAAIMAADITRTIEAIWRIEAAKLVAGLAHLVRDAALAEDLAQDALVSARDQWPKQDIPDSPGAWLLRSPSVARSIPSVARLGAR